jgi:hypothetical protein
MSFCFMTTFFVQLLQPSPLFEVAPPERERIGGSNLQIEMGSSSQFRKSSVVRTAINKGNDPNFHCKWRF